jgi:hypothetical protein
MRDEQAVEHGPREILRGTAALFRLELCNLDPKQDSVVQRIRKSGNSEVAIYGSPDERQIMKCISSPALDNVEIAMYIDGEADEAVIAHIQQCPFCSERARQWTLLQNRLRKQSYRVNCPTPMELGDYHLGLLPAAEALQVSAHLRECLLCKQEVAILEDFLTDLAPEISLLGAVRVLIARLISGQGNLTPAAALRGVGKEPLTYQANGILIVLDIQPTKEGKASIFGQIASDDQDEWTGARVELRKDDQFQASTEVDDLGTFQYTDVIHGGQELRIWPQAGPVVIIPNFYF